VNSITRMTVVMVVWAAVLPAVAISQQNQGRQSADASEVPTAPVIVDGRVLFYLRGVSAYPAERRAREVAERIEKIAADEKFPAEDLSVVELENQSNIMAGQRLIMVVVDADSILEEADRQVLAKVYQKNISEAIQAYRRDRSRPVLLSKMVYSSGAIVLLAVLLFVIVRLSRKLETHIERRFRSRIHDVRIQSFQLVQAQHLWLAVRGILHMVRNLLMLAFVLTCAEYILNLWPWTRRLSERSVSLVLDPLLSMANSIMGSLPSLVFIAILIMVVRYIIKLARLFFAGIENGTVNLADFEREWSWPTYKIFRLLVIALAAVVAYPYIPGAGSEAFKGISIFAGVIFSIGSTSIVSNTMAGYALIYRRVFKVGDRVQIGEHIGDVQEIRLQVTYLRTIKNEEIIVPNSIILGSNVINFSTQAKNHGLILHTTVGIGYETPWRQVESMLLMAADRTPGLLHQPPPFVLQKSLGDFCVVYEINVHCDRPQASSQLYTELHRNILDVFNEYGVQIMTPAYEGDPEQAKLVPKDKWFEAPASPPDQRNPAQAIARDPAGVSGNA
jgi:small-conductance mechanosensitive channel